MQSVHSWFVLPGYNAILPLLLNMIYALFSVLILPVSVSIVLLIVDLMILDWFVAIAVSD